MLERQLRAGCVGDGKQSLVDRFKESVMRSGELRMMEQPFERPRLEYGTYLRWREFRVENSSLKVLSTTVLAWWH